VKLRTLCRGRNLFRLPRYSFGFPLFERAYSEQLLSLIGTPIVAANFIAIRAIILYAFAKMKYPVYSQRPLQLLTKKICNYLFNILFNLIILYYNFIIVIRLFKWFFLTYKL